MKLLMVTVALLVALTAAEPPVPNSYRGNSYVPPANDRPVYGPPGYPSGKPNGPGGNRGTGGQQDDPLAEPAKYEFSYEVNDAPSGQNFGHSESRDGDNTQGSYFVELPDGRLQRVTYTAGPEGYNAQVTYEEGKGGQGGQGGYPAGGQGGAGGYPSGSGNKPNRQYLPSK